MKHITRVYESGDGMWYWICEAGCADATTNWYYTESEAEYMARKHRQYEGE